MALIGVTQSSSKRTLANVHTAPTEISFYNSKNKPGPRQLLSPTWLEEWIWKHSGSKSPRQLLHLLVPSSIEIKSSGYHLLHCTSGVCGFESCHRQVLHLFHKVMQNNGQKRKRGPNWESKGPIKAKSSKRLCVELFTFSLFHRAAAAIAYSVFGSKKARSRSYKDFTA